MIGDLRQKGSHCLQPSGCFPTGGGLCCQARRAPTECPQRSESWQGSASGPPPLREDLLPADRASPPALGAKAERHRACRAVVGRQAQLTFFGFCFYYLSRFRFRFAAEVRRRYRDFPCPPPAPTQPAPHRHPRRGCTCYTRRTCTDTSCHPHSLVDTRVPPCGASCALDRRVTTRAHC